jgi:hypothetical protein
MVTRTFNAYRPLTPEERGARRAFMESSYSRELVELTILDECMRGHRDASPGGYVSPSDASLPIEGGTIVWQGH